MITPSAKGNGPKEVTPVAGFQQFEFELTDALIAQLVSCLNGLNTASLDKNNVEAIPNGQGVYQLYCNGELQYIGKTDSDTGLTTRLAKHGAKISGRPNLRGNVTFKAVQVLVFTAMELETLLIRHYKDAGSPLAWQHSGFGSNDPGRNRDKTEYKTEHFDVMNPIDIDEKFVIRFPAGMSLRKALEEIKSNLPYTFRFAKPAILETTILPTEIKANSVRDSITALATHLPTKWQATQLPGYIILYPEEKNYQSGTVIVRT